MSTDTVWLLVLLLVTGVVFVFGYRASKETLDLEYPGVELASVDVTPGEPATLTFSTPAASAYPEDVRGLPNLPTAIFLEHSMRSDTHSGYLGMDISFEVSSQGRVVVEHPGFSFHGNMVVPTSSFIVVRPDTWRGARGAGYHRGTAHITSLKLPPGSPVEATVRIKMHGDTIAEKLRFFAAYPTRSA